ncbi:hypothetical protein I3842_Q047300 [Carya illinoinensis]|uniref:CLAVATA3/ESR (CLE)-related protein 46 n=1 Tax=Carya illinoinensis TaxID=32201 RepID=A0A922A5I9_CARIL|nr:hypothetical protein I3842_Q047300 [Carya illinoinensis]
MISSCFFEHNNKSFHRQHAPNSRAKMRRLTPIHLILAWLLLAASQYPCFTMSVQPVESVDLRLRQGQPSSTSHNRDASPSRLKGKKIHKTPSGPNPAGNHRPPFRHK